MADVITNPMIDGMYEEAVMAGALGGKVNGAGAGWLSPATPGLPTA